MKKYAAVLAALLMLSGSSSAAARDYVVMENGTMMVVSNGATKMMDGDVIMANGTRVKKTGTFTLVDGRSFVLQEGDKMDMMGNLIYDTKMPNPLLP